MRALGIALFALTLATPALSQELNRDHGADSTPSDTRRTGATNEQGERLVCRTMETSSTSRMAARRVCHTEAEWRALQNSQMD